jgi:soluble cytochrome b562
MSGLSINPVGSYYSSYYTQNTTSSAPIDFQNLSQALQSGDLPAARTAFAALQKTFQIQTSLTQSSSWSSLIGSINKITQALDSGNLASAQSAYADLQQDIQLQMQGNKHRSVTRVSSSSRS